MIADLIIHHAHFPEVHFPEGSDSLAISAGRITAIGRYEELKNAIGNHTQVIDARGKTLMPGFNDTHIHLWKVGHLKTFMLDLRGSESLDDMLSRLEQYAKANPDARWITARGYNEAGWTSGKSPSRKGLDSVVPDRPVYVIRTCAHIAVANTRALELAGVNANSPVPAGGTMHLGEDGRPNGMFAETALGMITKHIPAPTKEELKQMVRAARAELYRYGITAATDPAVDPLLLEAYHEMNAAGELGFRLNAMPMLLPDGGAEPFPIPDAFHSDFFNVNTVKFFSDGGLSGKTSALKGHYKDSSEQGILRLDRNLYTSLSCAAMTKGLGVATHAIGDAAIEFVLDIYKGLCKDFPTAIKRIEHLGLPDPKHLDEMAAHGIAASMQTIFLSELGKNFIKYLDKGYLDRCYPVRSVMQAGILTALSSDAPVVKDINPLKGIEAAVTRRTNEGAIIAETESINIASALRAYTSNAALISGTPSFGKLAPGQHADLILLDHDPLAVPPDQLAQVQVEKTFVAGKCVWGS